MIELIKEFYTTIFLFLSGSCIWFLARGIYYKSKSPYYTEFLYAAGITGGMGLAQVLFVSDDIIDSKVMIPFKDPIFWVLLLTTLSIVYSLICSIKIYRFFREKMKDSDIKSIAKNYPLMIVCTIWLPIALICIVRVALHILLGI